MPLVPGVKMRCTHENSVKAPSRTVGYGRVTRQSVHEFDGLDNRQDASWLLRTWFIRKEEQAVACLNTAYPWMRIPLNISTIGWNEPLWVGQIELRSFKQLK
ncbi:hypothetical protein PCH_Pc20g11220 [Penicillium rubens Wisconsin 54-1255]|uniref:Uncharacterized protein n=1 Tax=Penicillium rubens (strain ATCC 28089 / DSM 1075 / NRRL 1951 / Wisconsin 54-1255) TaxID=500485 RepID=B6HG59_PENRW|nr:hypothetical protein PCH_Pc20g11220 [Penicillium rubens Wisconsin 54-1255]